MYILFFKLLFVKIKLYRIDIRIIVDSTGFIRIFDSKITDMKGPMTLKHRKRS